MQRDTDSPTMSTKMEGYAGTEGGTGEIYRAVWKEEKPAFNAGLIDEGKDQSPKIGRYKQNINPDRPRLVDRKETKKGRS